jgi:hypothetical protein
MFRGRGFLFIVILIVLAAAFFLLLRGRGPTFLRGETAEGLPDYLKSVIPRDWVPIPDQSRECNFDDDETSEWLVVYRYDQTAVLRPYTKDASVARGPIGAAIFDTQNNVVPQDVGNPSPYASTFVIPYRLLPDFYDGKGQGYLGETRVEVVYYPVITPRDENCKVEEITVLGYADSPLPTRLSMFRWQDVSTGYAGAHFAGDARVAAAVPLNGEDTVQTVTTYNRLENHRSLLCAVRTYNRTDQQTVAFAEDPNVFSVDFCFEAPPDAAYPEGVVVAFVRDHDRRARGDAPSPLTNEFLLQAATVPGDIVPSKQTRIIALTNPASVNRDPAGGHACTTSEVGDGVGPETTPGPTPTSEPDKGWICGRETATVETELVIGGQVRRVAWQLTSIMPEQVNGDVYWRIQAAQVLDGP